MRVLMFSPHPAMEGGVVVFAATLKRWLSAQVEVDSFLIGQRPGAAGKRFRLLVPFIDVFRLARVLWTRRHDVYHLNPSLVPRAVVRDGLFLLILRLFRRRAVLVFIHGWNWEFFDGLMASRFKRFLFRFVYGPAERIMVLGSCFEQAMQPLKFESGKVIAFTTMFDGTIFAGLKRGPAEDRTRILFLGRLVPEKGIYELLEAFCRISQEMHGVSLMMAGGGSEKEKAKGWCAEHGLRDKVIFPGHVSGAEKGALLLNSDIFLLPSYHGEGCPIALLEAMAAGLAVITTPVGGIPDIVQDGVNGIMVQPRDVDAIEAALRRYIGDRQLRETVGKRNRVEAWSKYDPEVVAARIESHYAELCRDHGVSAEVPPLPVPQQATEASTGEASLAVKEAEAALDQSVER